MKNRIFIKIAHFLDKYESFCWADLTLTRYNWTRFFKLGGRSCKNESKSHFLGRCYCGKFCNGKLATEETVKKFDLITPENFNINNPPF